MRITQLIGGFLLGITAFLTISATAEARGRFGGSLGGPVGVHVGTRGGVGVSLPTPQVGADWDGHADVSVTADPNGVHLGADGPYGSSAGVSSDGDFYAGASQDLPGGAAVSFGAGSEGFSADAGVEVPLEPVTYAGSY